ncbi:glycoside hydrolase family 78 protein [Zopfia rhizophila CBS 207.26]|uniref:Glycoside hydrolase family 78 protein n=1 Tax=Zopfia rhizophila CBS 207.26 TaxID=1314779 RepID=A0A6A6EBF8_9PEZI|nr:glycoside hydrolase family 78 protein [Zopfia rhizophila CBS 207.26]
MACRWVMSPEILQEGRRRPQPANRHHDGPTGTAFGTFSLQSVVGMDEYLGFTFTESSMWISPFHCDSASAAIFDSPLWFNIPSEGKYNAEKKRQRGGFRYMSIWHNSTGTVAIRDLSVNFTASPEMDDLRDYSGYFNSDSERLNRVWYAGAYTNQLCSMDPAYGNALGIPGNDWYYNATIANGTSVLIDGAKRDRLVWPGDIAISGPSIFVSTNSLDGIKNGIDSLFILQQPDGRLPWAGTPFTRARNFPFSVTYHLYTLLDLYYYFLYTGEQAFLENYWGQFKLALAWSLGTIDGSRMANVTSSNDWLRSGMGGHNVEANAIFYHTLDMSLRLAEAVGDDSVVANWTAAMAGIKDAVNEHLWDPAQNLFFDNDRNQTASAIHPQDGNSWAVVAGIVDADRAAAISTSLMDRWVRPYGAPAPEAGATISPFATGFEVQAHYLAGFPERAVDLIEFMWADFMLDDPRMTNSSLIEGYSTNGDLHYAPYDNDARISHAHGWATGPTSALTFFAAGLQVNSTNGKTWLIQPRLGTLGRVTAGFETVLGKYSANWTAADAGNIKGDFQTPDGTLGNLILPSGNGKLALDGQKGPNVGRTAGGEEER